MATFDEILLPECFSSVASGGPEYATEVSRNQAGIEQRASRRFDAVRRYSLEASLLSQANLRELLAFFLCRDGQLRPFRYKDLTDYWASSDGTVDAPIATPMQFGTGNGTKTRFPLSKTYTSGGQTKVRQICKPIAGGLTYDSRVNTVSIYKAGVLQTVTTHYTLSSADGVVVFGSAPSNGQTLTWTGHYDVPVRFATDWFRPGMNDAITAVSLQSMDLIELLPIEFLPIADVLS